MISTYARRKAYDKLARFACVLALGLALLPLFSVLSYVVAKGLGGLSFVSLTSLPKPVGEPGGGFANALVGTLVLVSLATAISLPISLLAAIYLSEFGRGRLAQLIRYANDVLAGVPSIVVGVFAYSLIVLTTRRFSALSGGIALSVIMLPIMTRSTEELLQLVPASLREAGLALGLARWRVICFVVLRTAGPGIVTGLMLAVARAAGETAPLLFTALNNRFFSLHLGRPMASLPVHIYTYAISPFDSWHEQAWAAALVLVCIVLLLNLTARWIVSAKRGHS